MSINSKRLDGRKPSDLRKISITPSVSPYAEGSSEISFGSTKLLICASVERKVPPWMEEGSGGWITAEYGMLPRSTHTRSKREASAGRQSGRTLEIQRLIGRALRAAVDLRALEGITIRLDCDVLVADGGTRTAAISGAWVALYQALEWAKSSGLAADAKLRQVAAVSAGIVDGCPLLDLCYEEDSSADFDMNLVGNIEGDLIEVQGTAEKSSISPGQFQEVMDLATKGIAEIMAVQREAVSGL